MELHAEGDLPNVVRASNASHRLAARLHGRQNQSYEKPDNHDYRKQFDQRQAVSPAG